MENMKKYAAMALVVGSGVMMGCKRGESVREPETPQEMYAEVQRLLQPNVEHDASEFGQAMEWLRKAAEGGVMQAQTDLGGIYLQGGKEGVKADGREAFRWFSMAAEQGNIPSLYYMGHILYRGMDMPRDEARALEYWRRAAEGDVAEAQLALGAALTQRAESAAEGVQWLVRAAGQNVPKVAAQAASALGNIYAIGKHGVTRDMGEAARWYALAARGGEAAAQLVYAIMLLQGDPVPQDTKRGVAFLRLAAGQDNPQAIALLVNLLRNGKAVATDDGEAEAWAARLEKLRHASPRP